MAFRRMRLTKGHGLSRKATNAMEGKSYNFVKPETEASDAGRSVGVIANVGVLIAYFEPGKVRDKHYMNRVYVLNAVLACRRFSKGPVLSRRWLACGRE